jgi:lysophospholipase L1-like esterase
MPLPFQPAVRLLLGVIAITVLAGGADIAGQAGRTLEAPRSAARGDHGGIPDQRSDASARAGAAFVAPAGASTAATDWLSGFERADGVLRQRAAVALAEGQRLDVVAKLGDSITSSPFFLTEVAETDLDGGPYARLGATLHFFSRTLVPDGGAAPSRSGSDGLVPSLARRSLGAGDQWYVTNVLEGGSASPLAREIDSIRPGVAVVMFGTNDLTLATIAQFSAHLDALLEELERRHVIAILSTIPARLDQPRFGERVPSFNAAIRTMAIVHQAPLIDYAAAMADLPNGGLSEDGIHPSVCPAGAGSLRPECLGYGYNLRNLLTLLALERLQQSVLAAPTTDRLVSGAEMRR